MTHIYEYECVEVCACAASRKTEECNVSYIWWQKRWREKKSAETRTMFIHEYLENHVLYKYETILISFLHVM